MLERTTIVHKSMQDAVESTKTSGLTPTENMLGVIGQALMEISVSLAMLVDFKNVDVVGQLEELLKEES